jgi:hypothetical protein
MTEVILRLALFTALPVLLGVALVIFDRTAIGPVRRAEAFLIPLFLVGVGGAGVSAFISDVFIADPGSPFQREVGIANLALGLLGAVAAERRDGFREATVVAAVLSGVGVALVQFMDMAGTGNATLGTAAPALLDLVTPALLVWFLLALRRAEEEEGPPTILLRGWMIPVRRGSVAAVGIAATSYSVGYSTGQQVALLLAGAAAAAVAFWWIVGRALSHRVSAASGGQAALRRAGPRGRPTPHQPAVDEDEAEEDHENADEVHELEAFVEDDHAENNR